MTKYVHSRVIDTKPSKPANPCTTAVVARTHRSSPNPCKHPVFSRYEAKSDPSCGLGLQLNMLV